ncbi:MAG: hypothetical protein ACRYGK_01680 [Janthinobacterium lividum]
MADLLDQVKLAEKWEQRARQLFACAAVTTDEMGKRLVEHGAMCYFNCAQDIRALVVQDGTVFVSPMNAPVATSSKAVAECSLPIRQPHGFYLEDSRICPSCKNKLTRSWWLGELRCINPDCLSNRTRHFPPQPIPVSTKETAMNATFKFNLNEKITTPFGEAGIVTMCAVDDGGNTYYAKTAAGGNWFKESELS